MSISSEIARIAQNVEDAFDAIADKGVTVPAGSTSDDLADLIGQISGGGGAGAVYQDEDGYLVLSPDPPSATRTITANGSYNVTAYGTAVVNVSGGGGSPSLQSKSVTPTESTQTVEPDSGYDGLSAVEVGAISPSYVGSGVARRSSSDLTASGDTVTVQAGYYAAQASKAVASGTAGTPTATKGAVSNHAVTVTPSVTNAAGYIEGGTKAGTGVSVSASELVSGSETKTANGTYDVTNLAEVVVNVAGETWHIGTDSATNSDATATSLAFSSLSGTPRAFWVRCTTTLTRSSSYREYYVATMRYDGTNTRGNRWYRYNGQVSNITSGYSYSYANGTLTLSSSGNQSTSPGAFYDGTYELTYIY